MAVAPITGMLRRRLIVDLTVALSLGTAAGSAFWYGFHIPRTVARDTHYQKLEQERAERTAASAAAVGRRILAEIEETSLEELLHQIRTRTSIYSDLPSPSLDVGAGAPSAAAAAAATTTTTPSIPIPALQRLVTAHFRATRSPGLDIGGPHPLPLLYLLVAAIVAAPRRQAVIVVDLEARFDVAALLGMRARIVDVGTDAETDTETPVESGSPVASDDLRHVHVFRVDPRLSPSAASDAIAAAQQRVLYGPQRLRDRSCWGTLIVGSAGLAGTTSSSGSVSARTGLYGWLRIDAALAALPSPLTRPPSASITWIASSPWGSFAFQLLRDV
ncbi:cytochrome c oxidase family protein [Grosmannia clavigera kw1407]|uniref:Cytochrome c oxidase family protein n=1 Tax=Grosmannia clavigera (strain kw1407 / UAMH 11150) TaxID=655863 RepID=F0XHR0_GROCL|nr:cytochrome c oxidase family protein [Grosmannia clavigera kw1407]EFX03080.1 cytochrome c oxidase family protein [Grosmannia clavigera kw1407]